MRLDLRFRGKLWNGFLSLLIVVLNIGGSKAAFGGNHPAVRIIKGTHATIQDPLTRTTVMIFMNEGNNMGAMCTGSLIDQDLVLTAAHCVLDHDNKLGTPSQFSVYFGTAPRISRVTSAVKAVAFNWGYLVHSGRDDLAMLRITRALPAGYHPATLMDPKTLLQAQEDVVIAGYGRDENKGAGVLNWTHLPIADPHAENLVVLDAHQTGACFGDSGGPAFRQNNGALELFGVSSWVSSGNCDEYAAYTNATLYMEWINTTAAKLRQAP